MTIIRNLCSVALAVSQTVIHLLFCFTMWAIDATFVYLMPLISVGAGAADGALIWLEATTLRIEALSEQGLARLETWCRGVSEEPNLHATRIVTHVCNGMLQLVLLPIRMACDCALDWENGRNHAGARLVQAMVVALVLTTACVRWVVARIVGAWIFLVTKSILVLLRTTSSVLIAPSSCLTWARRKGLFVVPALNKWSERVRSDRWYQYLADVLPPEIFHFALGPTDAQETLNVCLDFDNDDEQAGPTLLAIMPSADLRAVVVAPTPVLVAADAVFGDVEVLGDVAAELAVRLPGVYDDYPIWGIQAEVVAAPQPKQEALPPPMVALVENLGQMQGLPKEVAQVRPYIPKFVFSCIAEARSYFPNLHLHFNDENYTVVWNYLYRKLTTKQSFRSRTELVSVLKNSVAGFFHITQDDLDYQRMLHDPYYNRNAARLPEGCRAPPQQ
jgi:hypothetical protein